MDKFRRFMLIFCVSIIGYCSLHEGMYAGCDMWHRISYPFAHANIWHLLANMWCAFVIIRSDFRDTLWTWALAYLIAISAPAMEMPVVGFSGVLYAVMGIISWQATKLLKFHMWTLAFLFAMYLIPGRMANTVHVYCYAMGILTGALINYYNDKRG